MLLCVTLSYIIKSLNLSARHTRIQQCLWKKQIKSNKHFDVMIQCPCLMSIMYEIKSLTHVQKMNHKKSVFSILKQWIFSFQTLTIISTHLHAKETYQTISIQIKHSK